MPLLLRHATAGHRRPGVDEAEDRLRPLDARGRLQAAALPALYAGFGVERLLTSPYVRCRQSVDPLASALGLPVEERDELAEERTSPSQALVAEQAATTAVLCTHGDILGILLGEEPEKGSTWVGTLTAAASAAAPTCLRQPRGVGGTSLAAALLRVARASEGSGAPRPGEEGAGAQHDAALVDAHLVDLVHGNVHEPAPEQACPHRKQRGTAARAVEPYLLDDPDLRRRPEHAVALAAGKRSPGTLCVPIPTHGPMVPRPSAGVGYASMNPE